MTSVVVSGAVGSKSFTDFQQRHPERFCAATCQNSAPLVQPTQLALELRWASFALATRTFEFHLNEAGLLQRGSKWVTKGVWFKRSKPTLAKPTLAKPTLTCGVVCSAMTGLNPLG